MRISPRQKPKAPRSAGRMIVFLLLLCALSVSVGAVRVKDICAVEGIRENYLVGYGLVVGLAGTGDDTGTGFTRQSLVSYLRRSNIQVDISGIDFENAAAVLVTAKLPPFARQGTTIDVTVSALGDAESLQGGTLIATPLKGIARPTGGPDIVYAIAQGPVSTGGFAAGQGGASIVKNHPTSAYIPNGAIVEYEVPTSFATKRETSLLLNNPDFTTARRIAEAVNKAVGAKVAQARNAAVVAVAMPDGGADARVRFLADIENLSVKPDFPACIVYNERTGTIVMGENVRISTTIVTHGNLIFEKRSTEQTVQPGAFAPASATTATDTTDEVSVQEEEALPQVMEEGVTVGEVAKALNALGVTARDIIAILQALKEAGALQAELKAM